MEKVVLEANERKAGQKSNIKTQRKNGRIPGVFYSKNTKPVSIDVEENSIKPLVFTAEAHLIGLKVNNEQHDCIIKDVQFDPVTDRIVHFDLLGLTSGEKFTLEVPLIAKGSAIGVKDGGVFQQNLYKLEIECLPVNIPQHLEFEVTNLKIGDSIHVSDLLFENIEILNQPTAVVASVTHARVEKEPTPEEAEVAPAEPEVIGKGKTEEESEKE
ncbi:MAG TPA: 50S ribosomal protein L25 [Ignavibacteriaceae bacterium]|nr:50S ribosomal protein L25 [Ignavibacteriaceae bacterium]